MQEHFTGQQKKEIVTRYQRGESVSTLCADCNVARSTLYYWIQQYLPIKSSADATVCYRDYYELKTHVEKLEKRLTILQVAGCGTAAPLQEKLAIMEKLHGQFSVHALCDAMCVARGTFYNYVFRRKDVTMFDKRREEMREHIQAVYDESKQRYGAKKICAVLRERGIRTSDRYVLELIREMNLCSLSPSARKEYKNHITESRRSNILQQQFNINRPNRVWISDVTCFKVKEIYYYICVVIDLFSRRVVAYRVSTNNSTYLITSTFKQAFQNRGNPQELVFYSDQGVQYTSEAFQKLLRMNKVVQSFSKTGKPHDNAMAESFFALMKKEELYRINYKSEREFRMSVDNYVYFYNKERPHGTLMYKSPERFEEAYNAKVHNKK